MTKAIASVLLISSALFSLEISIKSSSDLNVPKEDIQAFKDLYASQGKIISSEDAEALIYDNKLLANEYVKAHGIESMISNFRLEAERNLAEAMVREIQEEIRIDDEALLSYYVSHKKEFTAPEQAAFTIYSFETYKQADDFYETFRNRTADILPYVEEHNISSTDHNTSFRALHRDISGMTKGHDVKNYLLPPQFFTEHYSVVYVKEILPTRILAFEEVKDRIKFILYGKTFMQKKRELLERLKGKQP